MRTENDLRIALARRAELAPEPNLALLERAHRAKPRSRTKGFLTLGLAVAVVAALIAVPFALIGHRANSSNPPADPPVTNTDPLSWVSIDSSLYYNRSSQVGSGKELVDIYLPGTGTAAMNDYAPGRFDPSTLAHRVAVTVDGHAGYFGQSVPYPVPLDPGQPSPSPSEELAMNPPQPTLAWTVAEDQWVVIFPSVRGMGWDEATLQSIATTLKVGPRTTPVRLPFKLTYLPPGWTLFNTDVGNNSGLGIGLYAGMGINRGDTSVGLTLSSRTPDFDISGTLHRKFGKYWLDLQLDASDGTILDTETGQRILDSAVIASNLDGTNDSWFPVSSVVP